MGTLSRKIVRGSNDGYVVHDTSAFYDDLNTMMVGYDGYYSEGECDSWMYFENFPIPKGSTIVSADIELNSYQVGGGVSTNFYASLDDKPITSYSEYTNINATKEFSSLYLDDSTSGAKFSVDITKVIQEIIDNKAWNNSGGIMLFTKETLKDTADSWIDLDTYEWEQNALLTIEFVPADIVTFADVLLDNRKESFVYEHLRLQDGKLITSSINISEFVKEANISMDFDGNIIGSLSIVTNNDISLSYNDFIKVKYLIEYNDNSYELPLGIFSLKTPENDYQEVILLNKIIGYDLTSVLDDNKITESLTIPSGTVVTDYIKTLISGTGSWLKYNIQNSSETLKEDFSYVTGKSKLFIVNSLLNTINYYNLWADGNGKLRAIPWTAEPNITWNFTDNNDSLYIGIFSGKSDYSNVFNKSVVVANQLTENTEPLVGIKTFEDVGLTDHPYSYTNLGRYVTKIFQSEATSQSYVDARAERELINSLEIEETVNYKHAIVSSRENDGLPYQGDCYNFSHTEYSENMENTIYRILSFSYGLKVGSLVNSKIRKFKYFK